MYIFDFDGVLFDSTSEVMISAFNAITGDLVMSLDQLPEYYESLFRTNIHCPRNAGQMIVLGRWCMSKKEQGACLTAEQFAEIEALGPDSSADCREMFFNSRKRFSKKDPDKWAALNKPFEPIWSELVLRQDYSPVVLTNKNRQAVIDLFAFYGKKILPESIFSGDIGLSKAENLKMLQEQFPADSYSVVEDGIGNLIKLKKAFAGAPSLQLLLASWGYLSDEDYPLAEREGFEIITQKEILDRIPLTS